MMKKLSLFLFCVKVINSFHHNGFSCWNSLKCLFPLKSTSVSGSFADTVEKYTAVPGLEQVIRPSITDKARTITHVCTSGTLCTTSVMESVEGFPFGSYVDYILDDNGWPVLLLSDQSLHTVNIKSSQKVSLFCQLPRSQSSQAAAALSRVTLIGNVEAVKQEELSAIRLAFSLVHQYAGIYVITIILFLANYNKYGACRTNRGFAEISVL